MILGEGVSGVTIWQEVGTLCCPSSGIELAFFSPRSGQVYLLTPNLKANFKGKFQATGPLTCPEMSTSAGEETPVPCQAVWDNWACIYAGERMWVVQERVKG